MEKLFGGYVLMQWDEKEHFPILLTFSISKPTVWDDVSLVKMVLIYFCSNLFSVANFWLPAILFHTSMRDKKAKQIIANTVLPEIMLKLSSKINNRFLNVNIC